MENEQAEIVLDVKPAVDGRKWKLHGYAHYVPIYGKQIRTLKEWAIRGKDVPGGPDLPPLDRPQDMPEWWGRVMTQGCPREILDAARKAVPAPPVAMSQTGEARVPLGVPSAVAPAITTQEENLRHLKEQLARVRAELLEAQNAEVLDRVTIEIKEKKWRELRAEVDDAESEVFKMRKLQGKFVELEQIESTLGPMLATVMDAVRSTPARIKAALAAAQTEEETDQVWNAGIDEAFNELVKSGFMKPREELAA